MLENIINARLQRKELQRFIDDNQKDFVSSLPDGILLKVNRRIYGKLTKLVRENVKNSNFINISKVEFTDLEISILNLGPKHVFRDFVSVPDIVAYFENAA